MNVATGAEAAAQQETDRRVRSNLQRKQQASKLNRIQTETPATSASAARQLRRASHFGVQPERCVKHEPDYRQHDEDDDEGDKSAMTPSRRRSPVLSVHSLSMPDRQLWAGPHASSWLTWQMAMLTEEQAFDAMVRYLQTIADNAPSYPVAVIIADCTRSWPDAVTTGDPAAWPTFLECVESVLGDTPN
jgi:hypothetical protein